MRIDSVISSAISRPEPSSSRTTQSSTGSTDFADALKKSLAEVNEIQVDADALAAKVAAGDLGATQQAMVALQKASLALDLTVQVRNKIIEAYQELMRTQV